MRIPEGANWAAVRQYLKATRASEYDRLRHQHHYHHHQRQQQQQQQQQTRLAAAAAAACCSSSSDQTVSTLTFLLFPFGSHVDSPGPNNNASSTSSTSSNIISRRNFFSSILTDSIFQRQPRDSLKSWIPTTLLSSERRFFVLGPAVASSSSTTTNDVVLERQQQHCLTRVSLNPPLPPPLGLSNHLLSEGKRLLVSSSRDPTSICSVFFSFLLKSQYSTASGPECGQQKQSRDYGSNYGQADANVGPSMQDDGSEVVGVGRDVEGSDCSKGHRHQGGSLHSEHEVSRTESETGWSREDVVNWPNAISLTRLLSGPLLAGSVKSLALSPPVDEVFQSHALYVMPNPAILNLFGGVKSLVCSMCLFLVQLWTRVTCISWIIQFYSCDNPPYWFYNVYLVEGLKVKDRCWCCRMILHGFPRAALIGLALAGASDWVSTLLTDHTTYILSLSSLTSLREKGYERQSRLVVYNPIHHSEPNGKALLLIAWMATTGICLGLLQRKKKLGKKWWQAMPLLIFLAIILCLYYSRGWSVFCLIVGA